MDVLKDVIQHQESLFKKRDLFGRRLINAFIVAQYNYPIYGGDGGCAINPQTQRCNKKGFGDSDSCMMGPKGRCKLSSERRRKPCKRGVDENETRYCKCGKKTSRSHKAPRRCRKISQKQSNRKISQKQSNRKICQ